MIFYTLQETQPEFKLNPSSILFLVVYDANSNNIKDITQVMPNKDSIMVFELRMITTMKAH